MIETVSMAPTKLGLSEVVMLSSIRTGCGSLVSLVTHDKRTGLRVTYIRLPRVPRVARVRSSLIAGSKSHHD